MPQITLYDPENYKTYIIECNEEDAKRANEDLQFATYLLNKYLNSQITPNLISESNPTNLSSSASIVSVVHNADNATEASSQDDDDSQEKDSFTTDSFRWPHEAILLLFRIYTDNEHHLTSGKTTHKKFWELVSSQLIANGYNVTGLQCKSKMAGLKNTFKNIKDHNAKSGNSRRTWRYFDIMNEIFTKKPWVESLLTLQSGSSNIQSGSSNITSSDDEERNIVRKNKKSSSLSCENKKPLKRKKHNINLEKMIEENAARRERMHEEAMSRQDKLLDILQKFLQQ